MKYKKKNELPSKIIHEGRDIEDPTEIANAFNIYFAHIGKNSLFYDRTRRHQCGL